MNGINGDNRKDPEQLSFFRGEQTAEDTNSDETETSDTETLESEIPPEQSVALQELDPEEDNSEAQPLQKRRKKNIKALMHFARKA